MSNRAFFEVHGDRFAQIHDTVERPKTFETFLLALWVKRLEPEAKA